MKRASKTVQNPMEKRISKISKSVFTKIAATANMKSKFTGPAKILLIWKKYVDWLLESRINLRPIKTAK